MSLRKPKQIKEYPLKSPPCWNIIRNWENSTIEGGQIGWPFPSCFKTGVWVEVIGVVLLQLLFSRGIWSLSREVAGSTRKNHDHPSGRRGRLGFLCLFLFFSWDPSPQMIHIKSPIRNIRRVLFIPYDGPALSCTWQSSRKARMQKEH